MDCFVVGNDGSLAAMDRIQGMEVFAEVARQSGFAKAARTLRMSTAQVSKHVRAIEGRLGTRLFDRTTRRVALTEAGRLYLDRCLECLDALEDADASIGDLAKEPRGRLRVTAPVDFADPVARVAADVMLAHPGLVLDLDLSNRVADLVEERFDVAVRVAASLDGRFVARPFARIRVELLATPAYLKAHGRPRRPQDLASLRGLVFAEPRPLTELAFTRGARTVRVKLDVAMTSNHGAALIAAAMRSAGVVLAPSFLGIEERRSGALVPVIPEWSLPEYRAYAVYPHRRFLSPKVRAFVEALRAAFGDGSRDPWQP